MKKIAVILLFHVAVYCEAQENSNTRLALMQGFWQCSQFERGSIFKIVKDKNCLEFTYVSPEQVDSPLFDMMIGFQNSVTKYDSIEEINIDSLSENGLYYTEIMDKSDIRQDRTILKAFCIIPSYFECDGQLMSFNGAKVFDYEKISELPFDAIKYLHERGRLDKKNYIKEYLSLNVSAITPQKSKIYYSPNKKIKSLLKKDDVVIVIEGSGKWLKVRYDEGNVGWIKKDDVQ